MQDSELNDFLYRHSLATTNDETTWTALTGGVSSDIWKVELPTRTICVKRALPRLRVTAEWRAPVTRNKSEWDWIQFVSSHFPGVVPEPIAHDDELQMLAMQYLPPATFPVWKSRLFAANIDRDFAARTGQTLAKIHALSARIPDLRQSFKTDETFFSLRLEPYLLATAEKHPSLKNSIYDTARRIAETHVALVHGDVSPKNILVGRDGPVFLDAECAWYGDPAFDLAFCLNHFLLKCLARPRATFELITTYATFVECYMREVDWEARERLEARCANLLPMLFLARVDGKSPVEYITDETQKDLVRDTAYLFIKQPAEKLLSIAIHWQTIASLNLQIEQVGKDGLPPLRR
jgi:aminoglycoside phosphotransferase (APT) family kinase protein